MLPPDFPVTTQLSLPAIDKESNDHQPLLFNDKDTTTASERNKGEGNETNRLTDDSHGSVFDIYYNA
jgi:hypothetical protein